MSELAPEMPKVIPSTTAEKNAAKEALAIATCLLLSPDGGRSGDKAFYANFLLRMNVIWDDTIETAGVSITDRINFYISPKFLLELDVPQRMDMIEHEVEHIVNLHPIQAMDMGIHQDENKAKLYNIATDANINETLHNLTDFSEGLITIDRVNKQLAEMKVKWRLDKNENSMMHYEKLRLVQQELPPMGGGGGNHGKWGESIQNEELAKAVVKDAANKAAEATGAGNLPDHIARQLAELNKSVVNWKKQFEQFWVRTLRFEWERTRNKRNRRYGIIQPGKRKSPKLKVVVIGDESGSMPDEAVAQIFSEVDKIHSIGVEISYIPMDSEARDVVEYKKGMKMKRTACGGTYYTSGINKAKELKPDLIILVGDMDSADKPVDPKIPFMWCIWGKQNPPADFGKKVYIEL